MTIATVQDLYIAKLQELVSAEVQLTELLHWVLRMTPSAALKSAFLRRRQETKAHTDQLESIFENYGADPIARSEQTILTLADESLKMLDRAECNELREAILIVSARKFVHYKIAAYGSAAALAGQLGLRAD